MDNALRANTSTRPPETRQKSRLVLFSAMVGLVLSLPTLPAYPHEVIALATTFDFEDGSEGWTSGGTLNEWEWGIPTYGPDGANSGFYAFGTDLDGSYAAGSSQWLRSPRIYLDGILSPSLSWSQYFDSADGFNGDYGRVYISEDDGVTWTQIVAFTGFYGGWYEWVYDISAYAGSTIRVMFKLETVFQNGSTGAGWYIDDVSFEGATWINPSSTPEVARQFDFDDGPQGWTHGGVLDEWEWSTMFATDVDGTYENSATAWLQSPLIWLDDSPFQTLSWRQLFSFAAVDFGNVSISEDGGLTWALYATFSASDGAWSTGSVDISGFAGTPILVRFTLETDGSVVDDGWFVDDVTITRDIVSPRTPSEPLLLTGTPNPAFEGDVGLFWMPPADQGTSTDIANDLLVATGPYYRIYRSASPDGPWSVIGSTLGQSWGEEGLSPGSWQYYRVTASNYAGEGPPSEPVGILV